MGIENIQVIPMEVQGLMKMTTDLTLGSKMMINLLLNIAVFPFKNLRKLLCRRQLLNLKKMCVKTKGNQNVS